MYSGQNDKHKSFHERDIIIVIIIIIDVSICLNTFGILCG